jgi:hypothetical protein
LDKPKLEIKGVPKGDIGGTQLVSSITRSSRKDIALDMAQSRFFTIEVEGITVPSTLGSSAFDLKGKHSRALPIKSCSYSIISVDTRSLSVGVFRDIPLVTGVRLPKLSLSLYDTSDDDLEHAFRDWVGIMVPDDMGYVGYIDQMFKKMTYKSYSTDGRLVTSYVAPVTLVGGIEMSLSHMWRGCRCRDK